MTIMISIAVPVAVAGILGGVRYIYKKLKGHCDSHILLEEGLQASLRNDISGAYARAKKYGHISLFEKDALITSAAIYKKTGGNGLVPQMIKEVNKLEVRG